MSDTIRRITGLTPREVLRAAGQNNVFPVDVAEICYRFGIRLLSFDAIGLIEEDAKRLNAATVAKDGKLAVLYNQELSTFDRRMAIAVELAHICLNMSAADTLHLELKSKEVDCRSSAEEAFAGRLLIPSAALLALTQGKRTISNIDLCVLSFRFMAPERVVRSRLVEIGKV